MLPIYIISLIYIWVVELSAFVTNFLIKNGLIISYLINKPANKKRIKVANIKKSVSIKVLASTKRAKNVEKLVNIVIIYYNYKY